MWKIKAIIQGILSIMPNGEKINYYLQKANKRHSAEILKKTILEFTNEIKKIDDIKKIKNISVLEIGTGWQPIASLIFYLMDVGKVYTFDHVNHLRLEQLQIVVIEIEKYISEIASILNVSAETLQDKISLIKNLKDLESFFTKSRIEYHAPADAAKTLLKDDSIDLIYSHTVFEHIPEDVIERITIESKRILNKQGVFYHLIDLHDHYATFDKKISNFNFLKYSNWFWNVLGNNKINYQNRLREKNYIDIFKKNGAKIISVDSRIDSKGIEALKKIKINKKFKKLTYEELATKLSYICGRFE